MKVLIPIHPKELAKGGLAIYCDVHNSLYPVKIISFDEVEITLEDFEGTRFNTASIIEGSPRFLFHLRCLE